MDIRIKTANNQKLTDSQRMQKLEYATGLLQEANNILHLSADADETAEIPMKLRKLINYYHPEAGPDSDMLASNEGSTETTEDKKRQNNEQTDAQKPDEQERSPDTQTSPDKSQETSETSTEQNQNGQATLKLNLKKLKTQAKPNKTTRSSLQKHPMLMILKKNKPSIIVKTIQKTCNLPKRIGISSIAFRL